MKHHLLDTYIYNICIRVSGIIAAWYLFFMEVLLYNECPSMYVRLLVGWSIGWSAVIIT